MKVKMKKIVSVFMAMVLLFSSFAVLGLDNNILTIKANAANVSLQDLKDKFPEGKYWNHYCSSTTDTSNYCKDQGKDCYPDTVSSTACWSHSASGYSAYVGKYDCNRYSGATQCCGFAKRLSYLAYGSNCTAWSKGSLSSLKRGDVIHYYGNGAGSDWGHWVTVVGVSGSAITVGECNWGANCRINWTRVIYTYNLSSTTVYSAPWELPINSTPDVTLTLDSRYPVPFKCRIISTSKVQCYNDVAKTSSPGYIYPDDDCVVTAIYTNGLLKCECPWSDGSTKTVYIDKTAFINSTMTPSSMTASQYADTYLRSDGGTAIGWIDPGDSLTKVATSGSYTQIIYPASSGKRCAWVLTSKLSTPSTVSYPTPFYCRIRATEKVKCYNDIDYTSSPGNIYPDDDCTITALYSNGKVQCKCPWSDGSTKTVYIDSSAFFVSTPTPVKMTAPKYALTYLRSTDTSASWGWLDVGDSIYKLGTSGSLTQIIYPTSSGAYRCAWVKTADLTETYTVSYNANGGAGAPGNQTKTYNVNLTLSSTIPTWTGHTFIGWATSKSGSVQYAAGGSYTANSSVTLYAQWKSNEYNISYNANGGVGAPAPQTKIHGTTLTLSSTKPTRVGYTFLGWSTSSTATSATYAAGASYTTECAATLYAVWKINTYTVSYNANGGTAAPASQTKTYDVSLKLSTTVPIKDGCIFRGWTSVNGGSATEYNPGDYYSYDSDVTLYAIWESITLSNITIKTMPNTIFNVGDTFSYSGLSLTATYSDGNTQTISSGFNVSTPDMSTAGKKTVTVTFDGKTTSYEITVKEILRAKLTVSDATVNAGEQFSVDINITDNPGFCYLKLKLNYDSSKFDFITATNGTVSTDSFTYNSNAVLWDSDKDAVGNGKLVTLEFKAKEDLSAGDYDIGATFVEACNFDEEDIVFSIESGKVIVNEYVAPVIERIQIKNLPTKVTYEIGESFVSTGLSILAAYSDGSTQILTSGFDVAGFSSTSSGTKVLTVTYEGKTTTFNVTVKEKEVDPNTTQLVVGKAQGNAGDTVEVTLSLKNNSGIAGLVVSLSYDTSVLTLKQVKKGSLFSGFTSGRNLAWDESQNVDMDGLLATLVFEISEDAPADEYSIDAIIRSCVDEDTEDVAIVATQGYITVFDFVYGDANGDSVIDMKDVVLLRKYIVNYDYDTGTSSVEVGKGADANGDGKIDMKDVVLLRKYIVNYDYDTGTSTVVLGPQTQP